MSNLFFRVVDADSGDVISSINQHYVHKAHACEEWNKGEQHDPIFAKQLVASDFPASQAREDDDGGEACCPPAVEQRDGLQGECVDRAECWTRWHAREEWWWQTWRGRDGCELRPEAELEVARRTNVARLTGLVVVMRESGEDEGGGGGARVATLIAKICAATWPQRRGNMLRSWFAGW